MASAEPEVVFKKETVSKVLTMFFKDEKTKVSSDAVSLMAEMLKIFAVEAARRAIKQAENEDCDVVDLEHVEKILPELRFSGGRVISLPGTALTPHIWWMQWNRSSSHDCTGVNWEVQECGDVW
ncbi:centromere protein X isoform X2 [Brachyhypopomus gauderio]|uniref:centromere protein X isoform X2 n=1 Tax=Brachyhypopomus gauderio TaxID=698409 RepID=UPI004042187F